MPLFSIIVPIYNTEHYLEKCINSILKQKEKNFELILVDDGSPDRCPEICDRYEKLDSRIHVIHQKNAGVSSARNKGLEVARGDYIWFVDSDDDIMEDSLLDFCSAIHQKYADLYIFNSKGVNDFFVGALNEFIIKYYFTYTLGFSSWNKLYQKSIIQEAGIRFDQEETIGEDLLFNLKYYQYVFRNGRTGRTFFLGKDYYIYNCRADSAMNTKSKERLNQQLRLFGKARNILSNSISEEILSYLFLLHFFSGVNQSKNGGLTVKEFSLIDFTPYTEEIKDMKNELDIFFLNENASCLGKERIRLVYRALSKKKYILAGILLGLRWI